MITRDLLRSWGACWTDDEIAVHVPESGLTPIEVCDAGDVSAEHRLWVLLRPEIITERDLRLLACLWAERAMDLLPSDQVDPRSREAIRVARLHADGLATDAQLGTARVAAWAAAGDTTGDAAVAAARAAARMAAAPSDVRRVLLGGSP